MLVASFELLGPTAFGADQTRGCFGNDRPHGGLGVIQSPSERVHQQTAWSLGVGPGWHPWLVASCSARCRIAGLRFRDLPQDADS